MDEFISIMAITSFISLGNATTLNEKGDFVFQDTHGGLIGLTQALDRIHCSSSMYTYLKKGLFYDIPKSNTKILISIWDNSLLIYSIALILFKKKYSELYVSNKSLNSYKNNSNWRI